MEFRLLGPLEVVDNGRSLPLGGPKQRAVLAMLLLDANRIVSMERLIEGLWGEMAAAGSQATLQVYVSALRKILEPIKGEHRVLVGRRPGYVLNVDPDSVDVQQFDRLVTAGRRDLADERHESAAQKLRAALALWRGEPLADFAFHDFAAADISRLSTIRIAAVEDRIEAELACGRHAALVAELELLVVEHPLRERLCGQLMRALYRSGCQTDALAVFTRARARLVDDFGVDPGPELRALERQVLSQDPGLAPPPGSVRISVKLPLPPNPVVGRGADITAVERTLGRPGVRLVTLTGPGGTGKTSLALALAARLAEDRPGGVFFVPLADVSDPSQVLPAIGAVLEVVESAEESLAESIALSIGGRPTLLVLDNFEQVLAGAPFVADLLTRAPSLQILVTSRAGLHLRGEHEYPVQGLGLAAPGARRVEETTGSAAVALFVERMAEVQPDFELDAGNSAAVAEICRRLDGLPLAIELAAARGRLMDPAALLVRLDRQLRLLTSGARDLPGRQRTMRAAIDWSYDLLDDAQQRLFAVLGSMAGEFGVEAVAAAAGAEPDDPEILDGLDALVGHSMVRRLARAVGPRFRMLEPIREYASERLTASGAEDSVRRLLLEYLLSQLTQAQTGFDGPNAPRLLMRVETDYANLRAALAWAVAAGRADQAARLSLGLRAYWFSAGRLTEGREWLARLLAADELPLERRARLHLMAGTFAYFQDDAAAARANLAAAMAMARACQDDEVLAGALGYLGAVVLGGGDSDGAAEMAREALALARGQGLYEAQALALSLSAVIAAVGDDLAREAELYAERLELVRAHGDRRRIAETLNNLAEMAMATDDIDRARAYAGEALELARNVTKTVTRDVLVSLARIALADGEPGSAGERIGEALRLSVELGQQFEIAQCLLVFAGIAGHGGDPIRAARLYGCAARLRGETAPLDVELEPDIARQRTGVRSALGDDRFTAAQAYGGGLDLDQALTYALSV